MVVRAQLIGERRTQSIILDHEPPPQFIREQVLVAERPQVAHVSRHGRSICRRGDKAGAANSASTYTYISSTSIRGIDGIDGGLSGRARRGRLLGDVPRRVKRLDGVGVAGGRRE